MLTYSARLGTLGCLLRYKVSQNPGAGGNVHGW
jgi:hypothetical protein